MAYYRPDDDAGGRKCGKNQADHERGTAEVGNVKRQDRRKHGMLRVAEKLRRAQQQKSARPDGLGFFHCHVFGNYKADSIGRIHVPASDDHLGH
jgi:hypothetical protein